MRKPNARELEALRLLREALFVCEAEGVEVRHGSPGVYVLSKDDSWSICSEDDFLAPLDFKEVLLEAGPLPLWENWGGDDDKAPKGLVAIEQRDGSIDYGSASQFFWFFNDPYAEPGEETCPWDIVKWRPLR